MLNTGIITPSTMIESTGAMELGGRIFPRLEKKKGHSMISYVKAIRQSCDDYFYQQTSKSALIISHRFYPKSALPLKRASIFRVNLRVRFRVANGKKRYGRGWSQGETLITSIGRGYFLVTPVQIAKYTAFLATGNGVTPHFFT